MTEYVLGFRFNATRNSVVLILKARPSWQAGKLNGVGGKIEEGDHLMAVDEIGGHTAAAIAMAREFEEETGIATMPQDWQQFGQLHHDGNVVHLLKSFGDCELRQTTDEAPNWYPVEAIRLLPGLGRLRVMRNLRWMIPMALDTDNVRAVIRDPSKIVVAA